MGEHPTGEHVCGRLWRQLQAGTTDPPLSAAFGLMGGARCSVAMEVSFAFFIARRKLIKTDCIAASRLTTLFYDPWPYFVIVCEFWEH
jgi:hypothetical protein